MARTRIFKSVGFRLAVTLTASFFGGSFIAGTVAYSFIKQELINRHERYLDEEFNFFESTFRSDGAPDLIDAVDAHSSASQNLDSIYLLVDSYNHRVAGNISDFDWLSEKTEQSAADLGLKADYTYLVRKGTIGDYRLVIGDSTEDVSEVEEIVLHGSGWAALVLIAIALSSGIAVSQRMKSRFELVNDALTKVASGEFDIRVPSSGRGDDIDTLGEMMNDTIAKLAVSVESIRQISNDISHDLKTPLNRLRILIEEAMEKRKSGNLDASELKEAADEINKIIAMFDALLRIAQIESGARRSRFAIVDIALILKEVCEFYQSLADELDIDIALVANTGVAQVNGDRELLLQLFANLLENAFTHCPRGTKIRCSYSISPDWVEVVVADNGPGIPASEREKVLRRLYRLEQSRTTPGSGLGLSIVNAISNLHNVTLILADNEPGLKVIMQFPIPGTPDS